ncbi:MAG: hypothetical protein GY856_29610 [bacterium]|nr:hypothetical protein [bacterium]
MPPDDDPRKTRYQELALEAPRITALADAPLDGDQAFSDSFNLSYWLGPVYDILRHPQTRTPLTVAVYGSWGSGKTTAMRWLEGLLAHWNRAPSEQAPVKVRTVWFYPWKYQSREDVWRGLIAEVIIESLAIRNANADTVIQAAKHFGLFLGHGFLHVLAGFKGLGGLEKIPDDYRQYIKPEKAYLNEFEHTLRSWIRDTLGTDDRLLILIDDLDRCLPQVALEVLEALKLYLDIGQLIFVVGVDRPVIDELVKKHYAELGLSEDKSRQYLSKMFQIEVDLAPSARQIDGYLDDLLDRLPYWSVELDEPQRKIFRDVILQLARRNPREIKRLINSALMRGVGAERSSSEEVRLHFSQGLQLFFVRQRLRRRYPQQSFLVGHPLGDELFGLWSRKVRGEEDTSEALRADQLADQQVLLEDRLLEQLMQIEYPQDTSTVAEAFDVDPWIVERIAQRLDKEPGEVSRWEYFGVEELDLRGLEIDDLESLRGFGGLRRLNLAGARIRDLGPLEALGALRRLSLIRTEVHDVRPLALLRSLEELNLAATRVSDLGPLRELEALRTLNLSSTPVVDLSPLARLGSLEKLSLEDTGVEDMAPLSGLRSLRRLNLNRTRVTDLSPLRTLEALRQLSLREARAPATQVEVLRQSLPRLEIER